jgi:hypothetical protein
LHRSVARAEAARRDTAAAESIKSVSRPINFAWLDDAMIASVGRRRLRPIRQAVAFKGGEC